MSVSASDGVGTHWGHPNGVETLLRRPMGLGEDQGCEFSAAACAQ
jgi:hypothetical protein